MIVSIVKIWSPINAVEIAEGSNVINALQAAWFSADAVMGVKRNGAAVAMDTVLGEWDMLIVSLEKIKGGNEEDAKASSEEVIVVGFDITYNAPKASSKQVAIEAGRDLFATIRDYLNGQWISMNQFHSLVDSKGEKVSLWDRLVNGENYTIVIAKGSNYESCEDDEEYDD